MHFGYNTNGFAHHRLEDAIEILAELGYGGVAITLDHHVLNPFEPDLAGRVESLRKLLDKHQMRSVIETGARFLLDPRRKHQPTLVSADASERERRLGFLCQAINIARELGSSAVSFWSGTAQEPAPRDMLLSRLRDGCLRLCDLADEREVRLAFEPEPGMFIDTMARFAELYEEMTSPRFGLTLDVGHLHCLGETPIADQIRRWREILWNIHIEDMRAGAHDHLMFGEGEIDFQPVLAALREVGYASGIYVELSRHSYDAVETARRALAFLKAM